MKKIREDYRPIEQILLHDNIWLRAGDDDVVSIKPYYDEGQVWFAMLDENEGILGRIPESAVLYVWYGS